MRTIKKLLAANHSEIAPTLCAPPHSAQMKITQGLNDDFLIGEKVHAFFIAFAKVLRDQKYKCFKYL